MNKKEKINVINTELDNLYNSLINNKTYANLSYVEILESIKTLELIRGNLEAEPTIIEVDYNKGVHTCDCGCVIQYDDNFTNEDECIEIKCPECGAIIRLWN